MKPPKFAYHAPGTLDEAVQLLQRHKGNARVLAGGQSLIPMLNFRLLAPAVLIPRSPRAAVRFLHPGHADDGARLPQYRRASDGRTDSRGDVRGHLPLHGLRWHRKGGGRGGENGIDPDAPFSRRRGPWNSLLFHALLREA
ncbi:MAG: FAD binding domain-containing protein [Betaproteobacteria bacterium]|nr:FAD binding domain-containing protein [Betaproteobacteria bacterium]MBI2959133.1 FAD binding domain-containing protein [Betaproteobacteria bacterium]